MADMRQIARKAADWPTIQEMSSDLGDVSYRMIRQAVERGEIEAVRIGKIRVNPDSVERWLESRYWPGEA